MKHYTIRLPQGDLPLVHAGEEFGSRYIYDSSCYDGTGDVSYAIAGNNELQLHRRNGNGHVPFWMGTKTGEGLVGSYKKLPDGDYNLPGPMGALSIIEGVGLPKGSDTLAERLNVVQPVCEKCPENLFRKMKSTFVVDCATGRCGACGGVSVNHNCPREYWSEPLHKAGLLRHGDITKYTPIPIIRDMIKRPPGPWPYSWFDWGNVKKAHQEHFRECMANYKPRSYRNERGIVVVGGGNYFSSAYVTVRVIRMLGCNLPIELWHLNENSERQNDIISKYNVRPINVVKLIKDGTLPPMRIMSGWELKMYAVLHSAFQEVEYRDADSYPIVDPSHHFDLPEYIKHGAIFSPDQEGFDLGPRTWEAFGLPYVAGTPAFESGQFTVNKEKWGIGMHVANEINQHSDWCYSKVGEGSWRFWGDKESPSIAARMCGLEYAMSPVRPRKIAEGMIQHGLDGAEETVHRCRDKFTLDPNKGKAKFSVFSTTPQCRDYTTDVFQPGYRANLPHEDFCHECLADLAKEMGVELKSAA